MITLKNLMNLMPYDACELDPDSFLQIVDIETGAQILGDVVISMEKARDQAELYGHSFQREVGYLTAHSVLHLLGYDHIDNMERVRMREKEELIMEQLGLPASSSYKVDDDMA